MATKPQPKYQTPAWPAPSPAAIRRAADVLKSGKLNYWSGEEGKSFEAEFARWIGAHDAVAVSSGTAALQLALMALGIGPGMDVICTPYSFIASSSAALNAGARVVYADVGEDHMLNAATIKKALTPKTKAIVVVHLFGQVAEMDPILKLAKSKGIKVIEDCAQCLGGEYRGKKVGTLGDAGCFSFCQTKHITTGGEGGMVVTKSPATAKLVKSLRDHGWKVGSAPKTYERVGYNFRLTEIQSAIGREELKRLSGWNLKRRRELTEHLMAVLHGSAAAKKLIRIWPVDTDLRKASFWLVPFVIDAKKLTCPVAAFIDQIQSTGVGVYKVMWPLPKALPQAAALQPNTIGFWVHPTFLDGDLDKAVAAFEDAAQKLMRK